jgi:hypothetical protein
VLTQFYSAQLPRNARQRVMRSMLRVPKSRITRDTNIEDSVPVGILTFRIGDLNEA